MTTKFRFFYDGEDFEKDLMNDVAKKAAEEQLPNAEFEELLKVWNQRLEMRLKGIALRNKSNELREKCVGVSIKGKELWTKGWKFLMEYDKLFAEGLKKFGIEREKIHIKADKLLDKGWELQTESKKLRQVEFKKLWAESNELCAEGRKLIVGASKLWTEAVIKAYGNIKIEWKNWNEEHKSYECHLENGEVYGF